MKTASSRKRPRQKKAVALEDRRPGRMSELESFDKAHGLVEQSPSASSDAMTWRYDSST